MDDLLEEDELEPPPPLDDELELELELDDPPAELLDDELELDEPPAELLELELPELDDPAELLDVELPDELDDPPVDEPELEELEDAPEPPPMPPTPARSSPAPPPPAPPQPASAPKAVTARMPPDSLRRNVRRSRDSSFGLFCSLIETLLVLGEEERLLGINTSPKRNLAGRMNTYTECVSEVTISLRVEPLEEGGYVATSPDVPGLVAEGRTISECVELSRELARLIAESCLEHGDPLPPAFSQHVPEIIELTVPVQVA